MKNLLDIYVRPVYRYFRFPEERRKFGRECSIRTNQDQKIRAEFRRDSDSLVVFLIPGAGRDTGVDQISGGMLSIVSLYDETKRLDESQTGCPILMTFPDEYLFFKFTSFESEASIFRFSQLFAYFTGIQKLVLHIPEMYVEYFLSSITFFEFKRLKLIEDLQINILNQNVRLMPTRFQIDQLRVLTNNITVTTAHVKYCTAAYREKFGTPLHFFSTFASPDNYKHVPYISKRNLLILSPDDPEKNHRLISILAKRAPSLEVRVIKNLKYEEYKDLIAEAKWSVTFGEGLDFYFIEPVFSGAVSFAIYNELFFTPDFSSLRTIYHSFDELLDGIIGDLGELDSLENYSMIQHEEFNLCAKYYSKDQYRENIASFYRREYTYA